MSYSPIDPTVLTGVLNNQGTQATSALQQTQVSLAQNGTSVATVVMNGQGTLATSTNQATEIAALSALVNAQGSQSTASLATAANQSTSILLAQNGTSTLTVLMNNTGTLADRLGQSTANAYLSQIAVNTGTVGTSSGPISRVEVWGTGLYNGTNASNEAQIIQGRLQVAASLNDATNLDAFSRLRTSHPAYRFDGQFTYQFNTDTWDTASTSGSIAYDAVNRMVTLANDAGTNVTVLQSHYYAPYTPGRSQLALATFNMKTAPLSGQTKRVGYFDGNNGLFVEWDAVTGVSVNCISDTAAGSEKILQANWNIDRLDGSGPSGFTLDLTKTQIFFISMQALYVGRVIVGFDIDGNLVPVHAFLHANRIVAPYIQQAAQPIRYELRGTNATGSRMDAICASVMSEGGEELLVMPGRAFSVSLAAGTAVTAEVPMLAIRPKQTLNGVRNQGLVLPQQLTAYSRTNGSRIRLIRNGTISPATWVDVSTQNSMCEYSVSPTTVTGGETVYTAFCDQEGGVAFSLDSSSLGRILGAYSHLLTTNPADTFVLTAASVNATANVQVGINWKEIR